MSQPVPGTLDFVVKMNPAGVALVAGELRRTWDAWDARACRLAAALRDRFGLSEGDRVAWMLPNGTAYFDVWFALQKLGCAPVSVPYRLTGSEAAYIIDHSDARVVLVAAELASCLALAREQMPRLLDGAFILVGEGAERGDVFAGASELESVLAAANEERFFRARPSTTGAVVYTSGTTGKPKGAVRDLRGRDPDALRAYQRGLTTSFGFAPGKREVHLLTCPLYHSAPPVFANLAQLMGGCVVVMDKFEPEAALALIERERVTSTFMVPTMLRRIVSLPEQTKRKYDLSSLRRLFTGAAPCPLDLKERVIALFPEPCLYEFYGSTETAVVTVIGPEEHLRKPGSCGRPALGVEVRILDDDGQPVPQGAAGSLWVKSPMLVAGYYKNEAATVDALRDGFFGVGDVARVDGEGFVYIVDRKSDMIISGGVNISPAEVEQVLRQHPAVYDCAVIGIPNEEWGEEVKAIVQRAPGHDAGDAELVAFVAERLAGFKRPRSVDFVSELPYSPTGKLLRKELKKPYWEGHGRSI